MRATNRRSQILFEILKKKRYEAYRRDPLLWVEEVLGEKPESFKWSLHGGEYATHVWDGDKDPLSTAWQCLANQQWVGVSAATGTAKTFTAARIMLWFLDCFEDALVVTSAPKESQLTLNLWAEISKITKQFKKSRPFTRVTSLRLQPEGDNDNSKYKETWHAIGFVAGVGADESSATKAQGFHRKNMLIICEEAAGMNSAVMNAFTNTSLAANNLIFAIGNPDSETDELYKFSQLDNVRSIRISAFDFPNVVKNEEIYQGAVSRTSIDRRKVQYGEGSPLYVSRVRGMTPNDSEHSLIKGSWIDACDMHHPNFKGQRHFDANGNRILRGYNGVGVDVAASENGDAACLAWNEGQFFVDVHEFQCPNPTHLAYNLVMSDNELLDKRFLIYGTRKLTDLQILSPCVGVDTVGVGIATLNTLYDQGIEATALSGGVWTDESVPTPRDAEGKPLYTFSNGTTQWAWELRCDIENGDVVFDIQDRALMARIKKELTTFKYRISAGAVAIESKDHVKARLGKSPNMADALKYANWVRKGYRMQGGWLPMAYG
jgi:phage terminase large subunit